MSRIHCFAITLALVSASTARAGFTDVSVRIEPPVQTVPLGANFTIDIVADITPPVVGWGLDLTRDNLPVASQVGLPAINFPWVAANAADGDSLCALAFPFAPVNGSISGDSILLATLTFHADSIGQTFLTPSATPGDLTEGFPLDPFGFASAGYTPGLVIVTPEPACGLIGLSCVLPVFRHCRRRK